MRNIKITPCPPFAHKLIRQLTEAVHLSTPDLLDPNYDRSFCFNISISIQEARAIVELNEILNPGMVTFTKFNIDGKPIEKDEE